MLDETWKKIRPEKVLTQDRKHGIFCPDAEKHAASGKKLEITPKPCWCIFEKKEKA